MLFIKPKCPGCGKPWSNGNKMCLSCGYTLKVLACPKCMNAFTNPDINKRRKYMRSGDKRKDSMYKCKCPDPYIEINLDLKEYTTLLEQTFKTFDNLIPPGPSSGLPLSYKMFVSDYCHFFTTKIIYDRMPDHSAIDQTLYDNKLFFAFLHPELPKSKELFMDCYKHTYDELMSAMTSKETQAQLREQEKLEVEEYRKRQAERAAADQAHRPTCPICHSTNLTRITVGKRAVKAAAFGLVGALDDSGKTWKCNHCGSKF